MDRRTLLQAAAASFAVGSGCAKDPGRPDPRTARILYVAAQATPITVDPMMTTTNADDYFNVQHAGRLLRWKPVGPDRLPRPDAFEGELAESWSMGPDGVTVRLREARSEAGNPLTAEDVRWSFARAAAKPVAETLTNRWAPLIGLDLKNPTTVIDARTVRINCRPTLLTMTLLVPGHPAIMDSTLAKAHATTADPWAMEWLDTHSASFAPYRVTGYERGQTIRLGPNPNYWRGPSHFAEISAQAVKSASQRLQLLLANQIHFVPDLDLAQYDIAKRAGHDVVTTSMPSASMDMLFLQASRPPLDDVRIRQAISYGLDRKALLAGPYRGSGALPVGWVNGGVMAGQNLDLTRNVEKARALIAASGKTNIELTLNALPSAGVGVDSQSLMVLIQNQLAEVGIKINLSIQTSMAQYAAGLASKRFDIWIQNTLDWTPSAAFHLVDLHRFSRYGVAADAQLDRLTKELQALPSERDAGEKLAELNRRWFEVMPIVPVMDSRAVYAMARVVTGVQPAFKVLYYDHLTAG